MALTHVELYEALKGTVSDEAARLIAEVVPPAENVATKADVQAVKADVQLVRSDLEVAVAKLQGQMHAETTRTIKWMLGFSIPMWAGMWGTIVAILLKH